MTKTFSQGLRPFFRNFFQLLAPALGLLVVFLIIVFQFAVPILEQSFIQQKKDMCSALIDVAITAIETWDEQVKNGTLSIEDAKYRVKERLRRVRYGKERKLYYWILDDQDHIVMHPHRPDLENADPRKVLDPAGRRLLDLMNEMNAVAQAPEGGFIEYLWQRDENINIIEPKLAALKTYKNWHWIIGTGVYLDDLERELAEWRKRLLIISFSLAMIACGVSFILSIIGLRWRQKEETIKKSLYESESRYRSLFNSAYDAIILQSQETIVDCNSATEVLLRRPKDSIINHKIFEFFAPEQENGKYSIEAATEKMKLASDGYPQSYEWLLMREETPFYIEVSLARVLIKDQFLLQANIRDIDARKTAEEKLRQSQELLQKRDKQFRVVFETSPYPMAIIRLTDGMYLSVNSSFEQVVESSAQTIVNHTVTELGVTSLEEQYKSTLTRIKDQEATKNEEISITTQSGETKIIMCSTSMIEFDSYGCMLWIGVDITQTRKLQEQLNQSRKMDTIGQLAGGIAHDFNNMLAGIIGNAELLALSIPPDSPAKNYADTIISSGQRAADLTKKLLAFSRKGKSLLVQLDIHRVIEATVALAKSTIDPRIQLVTNLTAPQSCIQGDPSLIQNALLNLVVNARDAMPHGGSLTFSTNNLQLDKTFCQIHTPELSPGDYIEIDVADTGIGMSPEIQSHIFEPFFTTKPIGAGTGLGLSAVYGTIREHRGRISVYSEKNLGSIFKIYLPVFQSAITESASDEAAVSSGQGRILVVDDEAIIRNLASSQLQKLGYDVLTAEDGEAGLEAYKNEQDKIDLVLLDMVMPKMTGEETFNRLKKINPSVKVIFCSGFNKDGRIESIAKEDFHGFLQKPYRIADLANTIKKALGK